MSGVNPEALRANGLWNIFTGRKKYHVTCGLCGHVYDDKVPFSGSDKASSICKCCGAQNRWLHSDWQRFYNQFVKED